MRNRLKSQIGRLRPVSWAGWLATVWLAVHGPRPTPSVRQGERGDVPGWVLVTLMTALLVAALLAIALPTLTGLLQKALSQVS